MAENRFDPKDIKILSDILALVLAEPSGSAQNALEALRLRAKRNNLSGGALKNLFASLAADTGRQNAADREKQFRQRISELERELRQTQGHLRFAQGALSHTQMESRALMTEIATQRAQRPWRYITIAFGISAGLLLGIATSQFYHSLTDRPPIDRSVYFR